MGNWRGALESNGWLWGWFFLLELGALGIFFGFDALPFQDLPAHAGLIALRDRLPFSPYEQRYWVLSAHLGGYSLFRGLGHALAAMLGPIAAVRFLAALPAVLFPAALVFARRRLYGEVRPSFAFLGLLLSLGLMTLLGFASYLIALAGVLVGLTLWLELLAAHERGGAPGTLYAAVVLGALTMVVAHGFAFVLFTALCGITALSCGDRVRRARCLVCLAPALALAAWSALTERTQSIAPGAVAWPGNEPAVHFQGALDKLSLLVTPTLMTRFGLDAAISVALWVAALHSCIAAPSRGDPHGETASHTRALRVAAFALLALFFLLPHSIHWFGFVDGRLPPLVLMLGMLAAPVRYFEVRFVRTAERILSWAATAMIALVLVASMRFQREARGYREVLAEVPAERRLLNLPLVPESRIFTAHPFVHYDKLLLIERPMLVSDVWFHQGSALYPTAENPARFLPKSYSEANLVSLDWPSYRLEQWDYVLVRTAVEGPPPWVPDALVLARHEGGWWLYRTSERR